MNKIYCASHHCHKQLNMSAETDAMSQCVHRLWYESRSNVPPPVKHPRPRSDARSFAPAGKRPLLKYHLRLFVGE